VVWVEDFDALVSWDAPELFRLQLNHIPKKALCFQLNDTHVGIFDTVIDKYIHPSHWHADRFRELFGIPAEKQVVGLTNGTDPLLFATEDPPKRRPIVVYASSPDRGLHHLLRMWPAIQERVPDAELHIYYDMDRWLAIITQELQAGRIFPTTDRGMQVKELLVPLLATEKVKYFGGVSRVRILAALSEASILAYPCDPVAPTEGFSMTILESWAAGCDVLISDADALPELWGKREGITCLPLPISDDIWVEQIVKSLENPPKPGAREVPECLTFDWIASQWEEFLSS